MMSNQAARADIKGGSHVVTWRVLRDACKSPAKELEPFCKLAGNPANWAEVEVPKPSDVFADGVGPIASAALSGMAVAPGHSDGAGKTSLPELGGLNQSAILWGTADFVMTRAASEANIWFLDHMVGELCAEGSNDGERIGGKELLPRTCELLVPLTTSSYPAFRSAYGSIKVATRDDLYFSPYIAFAHLSRRTAKDQDGPRRDVLASLSLLSYMTANLLEGNAPLRAISLIEDASAITTDRVIPPGEDIATTQPHLDASVEKAASLLVELGAFLNAFGTKEGIAGREARIDLPTDKKEVEEALRYAVLAMAIYAQELAGRGVWPLNVRERACRIKGITCPETAKESWKVHPVLWTELALRLQGVLGHLEVTQRRVLAASRGTAETKLQALASLTEDSLQFLGEAVKIASCAYGHPSPLHADGHDPASRANVALIDNAQRMMRELAAGDFGRVAINALSFVGPAGKKQLPESYERALRLASDVMTASTPEAVSGALQEAAAPAHSYVEKHGGGRAYVEMNSFIGASFSREYARQGAGGSFNSKKYGYSSGLALPIGLEMGKSWGCVGSTGIFLQALDLGALAVWRWNHSDQALESAPQVGFAQVLAPGAYFAWGIPRAPLSLLFGVDLVPALRKVESGSEKRDALRVSARLAFDVPLYP